MDTAKEIYNRIRPLVESNLPNQLNQFDAFAPTIIKTQLNSASDETELGAVDLLNPQNIASYLVIIQSVVHLVQVYRDKTKKAGDHVQAETKTQDDLQNKVPDKVISELITIAKQVSSIAE